MKKQNTLILILTAVCCLILTFSFTSCGGADDAGKKADKKEVSEKKADEEPTREYFEAKLKELNIPVYETAEFDSVSKRLYGDGYQLRYFIPDNSDEKVKEVYNFYSEVMNKVAEDTGLERKYDTGNLIMLFDGNKGIVSVSNVKRLNDDKHLLQFLF